MSVTKTRATLTGRERVERMFDRRDHDRVPRFDTFWTDTIRRWQGEGLASGATDVHDLLDVDLHMVRGSWPPPFPGYEKTVSEDEQTRIVIDAWGGTARYWKDKMGTPEHIAFGCDSRAAWERTYKPAYQHYQHPQFDGDEVRRQYDAGRAKQRWVCLNTLESFEATRRLMGDEITLMSMVEDPQWVREVSRVYTDTVIDGLNLAMGTGIEPDGLWCFGDMAYKNATMCSPAMYRALIWPDHKRLADWAHDRGMKFIYHTDGDVNGVLDLYLEADFDAVQPLEAKANMDVRQLCPKYADDLAFIGNIDVMKMATNDLDLIEQEIASKFEAGKAHRNYVYHSDHSVPPQVSWATYQHLIELLERYGRYA